MKDIKDKKCQNCDNLIQRRSMRCKSCSKKGNFNPSYGKKYKRSSEFKERMRSIQTGYGNSYWKGNDVKYEGLHCWINKNINKSKVCSICGDTKNIDLANISGEYKREFLDWEYLCRRCHMMKDGRLENWKTNSFFNR